MIVHRKSFSKDTLDDNRRWSYFCAIPPPTKYPLLTHIFLSSSKSKLQYVLCLASNSTISLSQGHAAPFSVKHAVVVVCGQRCSDGFFVASQGFHGQRGKRLTHLAVLSRSKSKNCSSLTQILFRLRCSLASPSTSSSARPRKVLQSESLTQASGRPSEPRILCDSWSQIGWSVVFVIVTVLL